MNSMKQGRVISIGVFDGVHRGHRRVLKMLRETAEHHGLPAVVVTFDPHPRRVLQSDKAPPMLASVQQTISYGTRSSSSSGCARWWSAKTSCAARHVRERYDGRYAVLLCSPHGDKLPANVNICGEGDHRHCSTQHVDFEPGTHVTVQFVDVIETVRRVQASV